jgi:hypothetical protein
MSLVQYGEESSRLRRTNGICHSPGCGKVCSTHCINNGHVKKCTKHGEYYRPSKTCGSCDHEAERAVNGERKRKAEARLKEEQRKHQSEEQERHRKRREENERKAREKKEREEKRKKGQERTTR